MQRLVGPSRAGDQFHYHWAARECLKLLPGGPDLIAVAIEGPSAEESSNNAVEAGEEVIDVALYFGAESRDKARLVRYIQLKHSTRRASEPWTSSGLKKTIRGFAERFSQLVEQFAEDEVARRFRFEFTTNRPIDKRVSEVLVDLATGAVARHPTVQRSLVRYAGLKKAAAAQFFRLFVATGGEGDLWAQRNLLTQDVNAYLPDADYDAPVQLKELVTRKATTEFESDPSIRRHDVLRALKVTEDELLPARCLIAADVAQTLAREQEQQILKSLLTTENSLVIHADAGVGKSILAARLAASMPTGSYAVLYDCFGDGLYRSALNFRHRHRDALVQVVNELAAIGLCHPLIPTARADTKQYMRAFVHRLAQAVRVLQAQTPRACLCLIIDAADNAEMAAEEQREAGSFVRDLVRTSLPKGVRLAFTCRTHRIGKLGAPPGVQEIRLEPFSEKESAHHLRHSYPSATETEVAEFAFLSSSNPRVQALALSQQLTLQEMLKQLGPEPTTVDDAIGDLLDGAVARLRDQLGPLEAPQIDLICQGLAVLRPLVPVPVLARLSGTSEPAVRSFALDLGRPLLIKGNSLHFRDEPTETWFRERFQPDAVAFTSFVERIRPLAAKSAYAAAALPQLLLQAGQLDELVTLALSGDGLPSDNPLERRDVELQRLIFALKACLSQGRHLAAAKLALRAGGESAGKERQNKLIQDNTDLAAALMAPDRVEEVVSRRIFSSDWMGSHHAYDAGLLSGREELFADASSRLRMAMDWLYAWARRPEESARREKVSDQDRAELAMALLRLRGTEAAARFLRSWTWRRHAFDAGCVLSSRLIDLGQYQQLDALAESAGNDVWVLLAIAAELSAVGRSLTQAPLARLLRLLCDRRVKLSESQEWNADRTVLYAVQASVEQALHVLPPQPQAWANLLRRYLPGSPPEDFASRFGFDRAPMLRAYALEAALRGQKLALSDVAPPKVRRELEAVKQHSRSHETEVFTREVGGVLAWFVLGAEIKCGRAPAHIAEAIEQAVKSTASVQSRNYDQSTLFLQTTALEWLRLLRATGTTTNSELDAFRLWLSREKEKLWPDTLVALCRWAARSHGLESLAMYCAQATYQVLEPAREDAEVRAASYVKLARAVLAVSPAEAGVYFDRAVEISSRIGDENLARWSALLQLAKAAGVVDKPRAKTAYRLSRVAELTYEYVARDKHFDWEGTVEALTDLCASSAFAILSRWRDRRFGAPGRLLPIVVYRLVDQGRLPATTPVIFAGVEAEWDRLVDLRRVLGAETDPVRCATAARIAYRYMRVQIPSGEAATALGEIGAKYELHFPDIDRIVAIHSNRGRKKSEAPVGSAPPERHATDWDAIFQGVDLTSTDALRAAHSASRNHDPPFEFDRFFREAFARVKIGREADLVRAFTDWPDFGIFELRYLLDALPVPRPTQVSFRTALRDAVLSVCRREPTRVQRRGWGRWIRFEELDAEGIAPDAMVVRATLEGFSTQLHTLGSSEFFKMLDPLATLVSPDEAEEALNFGLDLLQDVLKAEDGDGAWRPELQPPSSLMCALAGYVWVGLGSPIAAERWQYAHAVRSSVELGASEFLGALIDCGKLRVAGAFADHRLEFYVWHAQQWLLVGLARGAFDNAAALRAAVPLLQASLSCDHVLIRGFAAEALQKMVEAGELDPGITGDMKAVNKPTLPVRLYDGRSHEEDDALDPEETLTDEEKYHFGIDIGPYWFGPLGRAFGLSEKTIERLARQALRRHMGWSGGGWRKDERRTRQIFGRDEAYHSHGSMPKTDDRTAYQAYHAMMFVAAVLLKERSVIRRPEEAQNAFDEWLSDQLLTRQDGMWLADRRDPCLAVERPAPDGHGDKTWRWSVTANYLDTLLLTDDGLTVLWGHWLTGDEHSETVSVRSALVSRVGAEALVAALQTAPELGRFALPSADEEREGRTSGAYFKLDGWVTEAYVSGRLDERDPWGQGLRYPGSVPSQHALAKVGLSGSADGRSWTDGSGTTLRSETWTRVQGHGREEEVVSGWRLSGNERFLKCLLESDPERCLVLSVEISRRVPRYATDADDTEYPQPYARYYLMEADGVAHAL